MLSVEKIIVFVVLFCVMNVGLSQNTELTINKHYQPRLHYADSVYAASIVENQLLRHGRQYTFFRSHTRDHQFLISRHNEKGQIVFDGLTFKNVTMNYDAFNDEVLINVVGENGIHKVIVLDRFKISSFIYKGHKFLNVNDTTKALDGTGFYELAYEGGSNQLLIKRKKILQNLNGTVTDIYIFKSQFFIVNSKGSYPIRNKKNLVAIFENDKEIKTYINQNKIKFTKGFFEKSLIAILSKYDVRTN